MTTRFFAACLYAIFLLCGQADISHAAQPQRYLLVGARDMILDASPEETMRAAGIPSECRNSAHTVLQRYVAYGFDTPPYIVNPALTVSGTRPYSNANANLTVLCEYFPAQGKKPATYGRARYVKFTSQKRNFEYYILYNQNVEQKKQAGNSRWSPWLILASFNPRAGQSDLHCMRNGSCASSGLLRTPIDGASISRGLQGAGAFHANGSRGAHNGVDYAAPMGTPIMAAGNGLVIRNFCDPASVSSNSCSGQRQGASGGGNTVSICHSNNMVTQYMHMRERSSVAVGTQVTQGQVIGYVGSTGGSTGPHLHYEVTSQSTPCQQGIAPRSARTVVDPLTMNVASLGPTPALSPGQANTLSQGFATADDALAVLQNGGIAGTEADGSCYIANGTSRYPALCGSAIPPEDTGDGE